jgi:hypothetical protein
MQAARDADAAAGCQKGLGLWQRGGCAGVECEALGLCAVSRSKHAHATALLGLL